MSWIPTHQSIYDDSQVQLIEDPGYGDYSKVFLARNKDGQTHEYIARDWYRIDTPEFQEQVALSNEVLAEIRLEELTDQWIEAFHAKTRAAMIMDLAENAARNELADHLGMDRWYLSWKGPVYGHRCPTSPVKSCVYNLETDPQEDECLFCNNPNERK